MKKLFWPIFLFLFVSRAAAAMPILLDECPTVVVTDFGDHPDAADAQINLVNVGRSASEYVMMRLIAAGRFTVMDSTAIRQEIDGKPLDTVGVIAPDDAEQIGKLANARYLIYGNVTSVGVSDTATGTIQVGTTKADIVLRMMDVLTGEIVMAAKGEGRSRASYSEVPVDKKGSTVKIGTKTVTQDSVTSAIRKAAFNAVDLLVERLYGKEDGKKAKKDVGSEE